MSHFLASVSTLSEAKIAFHAGADWLDLKQPAAGALGAVDLERVREIVHWVQNRRPVSLTLGDLPLQADILIPVLQSRLNTGANFIKIGLFPNSDMLSCLQELCPYSHSAVGLIAVFFADYAPDFSLLPKLAKIGFKGVMLDTARKNSGTLTDYLSLEQLATFIQQAKKLGLMTGLAGSLQQETIAGLLPLGADYLGFRGALCQQKSRTLILEESRVAAIYRALHHK
jgi:dihydroneopterin aldolase